MTHVSLAAHEFFYEETGAAVLLSAFIDNIPYIATMLPVVSSIASMMGIKPYLFAFGLLIGAALSGAAVIWFVWT